MEKFSDTFAGTAALGFRDQPINLLCQPFICFKLATSIKSLFFKKNKPLPFSKFLIVTDQHKFYLLIETI
jgi:hypothetical protein